MFIVATDLQLDHAGLPKTKKDMQLLYKNII